MKNQNKKLSMVLVTTIFGVVFVIPQIFSNIAEATNFGAGGTGQWLRDAVLDKTSTVSTTKATSQWATQTGEYVPNYVIFHGLRFKIVAVDNTSAGENAKVTLWSYAKAQSLMCKYESSGSWGTDVNKAYANSDLRETADGMYSLIFGSDNRIQQVTLAGETIGTTTITYQKSDSVDTIQSYVWAPSYGEIKDGGTWGFTNNDQRKIVGCSWLRSPDPDSTGCVYGVEAYGSVDEYFRVDGGNLVRPALQILNQTSWDFKSAAALTFNKFTDNSVSGTEYAYVVDTTATQPKMIIGTTTPLKLNGEEIYVPVTTRGVESGTIVAFSASDSTVTESTLKDMAKAEHIQYLTMAEAEKDFSVYYCVNVSNLTGKEYRVNVFGMELSETRCTETEYTTTEFGDGIIEGICCDKGVANITVGSKNSGIALWLAGGAVAKLDANANNFITVYETADTGKLNIGTSNYTYSGNIVDNGTLTVEGIGTLAGTISGTGKIVIDGIVSADVSIFTQTGGLEVKDSDDVLKLIAGTLSKDVTNAGIVKLDGATLGGNHVTTGTLEFAKDISLDVTYVTAPTNIVDSGVTLTLTGNQKTLGQAVSGAGKVVIDGTVSADTNKFNQNGGLEVKKNLIFTSSGLDVSAVGGFTQAAGSNVTVDASKIQADSNDPSQALFTGVNDTSKFNVSAGNLTLTGTVQEGKYYVLVAGTAVSDKSLTAANLWNIDNITVDGMFNVEYATVATGDSSIAIQVTNATTYEEINTSGLAAVQQGNISVAKEFTGEVENHLGMIANPKLVEKEKYDKEIWASYIHTKETTEGMNLGVGLKGDNTAQYNGTVVGVDFYSSRKAIAGMALSYVDGNINSHSGDTSTKNDAKYYGVSFYDRVTNGNTALIYDIGYIRGDNDISQFYTGKEITADVKTDTYTAGVRYEAEFGTKASRVVPFASFRYMRQNNKDYTNSHNTRFESSNQNLYIPKVGIAWTGDFAMPQSTWTWRPSVEAGYLWNLGDRSVNGNVSLGIGVFGIEYDTVDRGSYYARAGMEFINRNFTAGVFYRYLKGDAVRNNKWNVNVSWAF